MSLRQLLGQYFTFIAKIKFIYVFWLVVTISAAVVSRSVPYLYAQIIDTLKTQEYSYVETLVIVVISLMVIVMFLQVIRQYLADYLLINHIHPQATTNYVKALQDIDYDYHTNKSSGSLISLSKRGHSALFTAFWEINGNAIMLLAEFAIAVSLLFTLNKNFAGIIAASILVSLISGSLLIKLNVRRRRVSNDMDDIITGLVVDNMTGFETVKIFAQEEYELERLEKSYQPWIKATIAYTNTFRYLDVALGTVSILTYIATFTYGLYAVKKETITIGVFVAALIYVFDTSSRIYDLIYKMRDMAKVYVDLEKFFAVMMLKPKIQDPPNAVVIKDVKGEINFNDVSFSYNVSGNALKNINLNIKPDEKVALVGRSGSGKTTLTKLLLRFYDVSQGEITLDGHNIKAITQRSLRKSIGLVPQDPVLFNETIGYNIAYANPDAPITEIRQAAAQANLDEFIEQLPQKYDTVVGERGIKLSGGQKQRLAIARLILENPEIIIFDEATSQLDSFNETLIQEALWQLFQGRTTIIIAHRLSTIQKADRIIVFDNGTIVEQGRHEELIRAGGTYARLWKLQTDGYIG